MKEFKKGELAFLPSDLTLLQFSQPLESSLVVQKFFKTLSPTHAIVVECKKNTPYCFVLYNGEKWAALKTDIYPPERISNDC